VVAPQVHEGRLLGLDLVQVGPTDPVGLDEEVGKHIEANGVYELGVRVCVGLVLVDGEHIVPQVGQDVGLAVVRVEVRCVVAHLSQKLGLFLVRYHVLFLEGS